MSPSEEALVIAVNAALADPVFRERVTQMHADGMPLIQMVEALGLAADLTDRIRQALLGLPPEVEAGIRAATLEMLDGTSYQMPLDCTAGRDQPVAVDVAVVAGTSIIQVRPAAG